MTHLIPRLSMLLLVCLASTSHMTAQEKQTLNTNNIMEEKLNLTQEWDTRYSHKATG